MSTATLVAVAVATAPNGNAHLAPSVWYLVAIITLFPLMAVLFNDKGSDFNKPKYAGITYLVFNFLISLPVCVWLF